MAEQRHAAAAERLARAAERVERWRRTRAKQSPMPAHLWAEAVALARVVGVHPVKIALRLNYESLRQRLALAGRGSPDNRSKPQATASFVELSGAQLLAPSVSFRGACLTRPGAWWQGDAFRGAGYRLSRRRRSECGSTRERRLVVPGHPVGGRRRNLGRMAQHRDQVLEGRDVVQFRGVDEAHEDVADPCAVERLVEKRVLAVEDHLLQGPLADAMPTPRLCRVGLSRTQSPGWCA